MSQSSHQINFYIHTKFPPYTTKTLFETEAKPYTVQPKMHSLPQDIVSERDSDHKTSKQDQYVDFNVLEKKESKDASEQSAPSQLKVVDGSTNARTKK